MMVGSARPCTESAATALSDKGLHDPKGSIQCVALARHTNVMPRFALLGAGAVVFCVLVLINVGGYRYGVSDQAFYVPMVLQSLEPELYPHDTQLMAAQDRFFMFDDWLAPMLRLTGISVPVAFLGAYLLALLVLYGATVSIGRTLYRTWWAVGGLVVGLTLRHRILDTAVNTLESYFHPRLLAFAMGLAAVALFLRHRTWWSILVVALSFFVHPTTAAWYTVWVLTAGLVADRDARRPLAVLTLAVGAVAAFVVLGPLREQLVVMDDTWLRVLASKDYLIATDWPPLTWLVHMVAPIMIAAVYHHRRSLGLVSDRETGLVIGCGALLLLFIVSVPLASARVALVVQLQLNRILWLLDIFASCYLGWLLFESPLWFRRLAPTRVAVRRAVVVCIALLAIVRGSYVMFIERAGHPLVRPDLAATEWNRVMTWASDQPIGTNFLTDPGHAWRYGTSLRAASGRDVYLEEIKDIGIAIYSRQAAHDVAKRIADLGNFDALDPRHAQELARRYDLDYLITEQDVALPLTRRFGQFAVYDLGSSNNLGTRVQPPPPPNTRYTD